MPFYIFRNKATGETRDILQSMNDTHEYHGEDGNEDQWERVWTVPQMAMDTNLDPNDAKSFVRYTGAKKGTYGDLQDTAKELSERRAQKNGGVDPVKEKFFKDYSSARKGAKHPEELKAKSKTKSFSVDWN